MTSDERGAPPPPTPPMAPPAAAFPPPQPLAPPPVSGTPRPAAYTFQPSREFLAKPGQLVPWARLAQLLVWTGVLIGLAMVARSATVTGLGTWWTGPPARPRVTIIVPFLPPIAVIVAVLAWSRFVPYLGIGAALLLGLVAWADIGYVKGYAAVEAGLAACALVVSLATLFGRFRRAAG